MAHDVFISYSTKDKTIADATCASLEGRKIRCFIAPRDIVPGITYAESLISGLNSSRLMVLVFSSNSNSSPQVIREVERAVHKGIPIIPLRIEDVIPSKSMEYFVSSSHWLDAMTPPLEKHLQKLADTVQLLLSSEATLLGELPVSETPASVKKKKVKPMLIVSGCLLIIVAISGGIFLSGAFNSRNLTPAAMPAVTSPANSSSSGAQSSTVPRTTAKNLPPGVLYMVDFNDLSSGWPRGSNDNQFNNYENGEYVLQGKKVGLNFMVMNQNTEHFSDMVMEAEGRLAAGPDTSFYGVVFHIKDNENYYAFMISGDGSYALTKRVNGVFIQMIKKTPSTFIKKTGNDNIIKVNCRGSDTGFFVNGSHLTDISDPTFKDGWIGLFIRSNDAPATARFRSIRVLKNE